MNRWQINPLINFRYIFIYLLHLVLTEEKNCWWKRSIFVWLFLLPGVWAPSGLITSNWSRSKLDDEEEEGGVIGGVGNGARQDGQSTWCEFVADMCSPHVQAFWIWRQETGGGKWNRELPRRHESSVCVASTASVRMQLPLSGAHLFPGSN